MPLLILEINHHTAPLEVREHFAFSQERVAGILRQLAAQNESHEVVLISTCNRTKIICASENSQAALASLCQICEVAEKDLQQHWRVYHDEAALRHLVRVSAGLDSLILGEPQIFGQVKDAYELAHQVGTVGKVLHAFFQFTFFLSKKVRTETAIGKDPVSVAFAAVNLAKHIFADLSQCKILLLGAGETAELAAKHFAEYQVKHFFFVNRTLENAERLAQAYHGSAFDLQELSTVLPQADIILTATESPTALITYATMKNCVQIRSDSRLLLDLSVPRNIAAEVASLPDCYLYTIDDLQTLVQEGLEQRREAAKIAEEIIEVEIEKFFRKQRLTGYAQEISQFNEKVDKMIEVFAQEAVQSQQVEDAVMLGKKLAKKIQHEALIFFRGNAK
jgi:glutamyl-tRNA reductase